MLSFQSTQSASSPVRGDVVVVTSSHFLRQQPVNLISLSEQPPVKLRN